jgi:hypothetical protein
LSCLIVVQPTYHAGFTVEADERSQLPHAAPLARHVCELRPRLRPRVLRRLVFREDFRL